jgi:bacterioferritin-associated ferredoxin
MIICSCNVYSHAQVQAVIANQQERPRMSHVYASLGCAAQCGRCAKTINGIIQECWYRAATDASPNAAY